MIEEYLRPLLQRFLVNPLVKCLLQIKGCRPSHITIANGVMGLMTLLSK